MPSFSGPNSEASHLIRLYFHKDLVQPSKELFKCVVCIITHEFKRVNPLIPVWLGSMWHNIGVSDFVYIFISFFVNGLF